MALWNFVIYRKSDFSALDFNGAITTNPVLNPIFITIEDNDDWLGGTIDPTPAYDPIDTNGQQTLASSSDATLLGQTIMFHHPVSSQDSSLFDDSGGSGWISIVDISLDGVDDYVMAFSSNVNTELTPNTTYNDTMPGNGKFAARYDSSALPCYAHDTLLATPAGDVAIRDIRVGDMVLTADHGPQPVRWIGSRRLDADALRANPKLRPVRIRAGAMGLGLPERDLLVSQQHRLLVRSPIARRMCGAPEVLVAAIRLVGLPGIALAEDVTAITYAHLLLDRHEVLRADGAPAESLYPGPHALDALADDAQDEIHALFPELVPETRPWAAARPFVETRKARKLVERHRKNARPLLDPLDTESQGKAGTVSLQDLPDSAFARA